MTSRLGVPSLQDAATLAIVMSADSNSNIDSKKLAFFWGPVPTYYWVLTAMTGVITLVCNGVVIFIILKRERLFRNPSNWLLLSLAFSDLTVGIIMIPSLFICYFSTVPCNWDVNKKVYDLFLYISVANLCFLTMDRYIAVVLLSSQIHASRSTKLNDQVIGDSLAFSSCCVRYPFHSKFSSHSRGKETASRTSICRRKS